DFYGIKAQFRQIIQFIDDGIKGAFWGKSADMELINNQVFQWGRVPGSVFPAVRMMINHLRPFMDPIRLGKRSRIRTLPFSIQKKEVSIPRSNILYLCVPIAPWVFIHRYRVFLLFDDQLYLRH